MITDADLKKIDKLLDRAEERLDQRIEESNLELQKEIILLKAEMKREFRFLDLQDRVDKLEQKVLPQTFS